jgi:hypothetical protein
MSRRDEVFRINSPAVVHEIIDGEAVIVNMKNGSYYSVDGVGAVVWGLIDEGKSLEKILGVLRSRYAGEPDEIEEGLSDLVHQLQKEKLILPDGNSDSVGHVLQEESSDDRGDRVAFRRPVLQKYSDMEELLLLDPVQEAPESDLSENVQETGVSASPIG